MMKEQGCFKCGRNAWMMMCFWVLWGIAAPLVGSVRLKQNINREWKFILGDVRGAQRTDYDDEEWDDVHLPHSFSMPYFMWHTAYQGYGWYRKEIDIPRSWKRNKRVSIEFEGVFLETEVYVNGCYVGKHTGGYTGFHFDVTSYLKTGSNLIAVRVNNLWNPRVAPRAGDHQFSGGIYRDVYLSVTDRLHVDYYGTFVTTPRVSKTMAECNVQTEIRNVYGEDKACMVKTEIYDRGGQCVTSIVSDERIAQGGVTAVQQTLPAFHNPRLWTPETPYLYKAVTTILLDKKVVDRYETSFGIRWFEWTADKGFFLNGEHLYLRGANVHQDQAGWGDAVTNAALRRDVKMIKDAGFNCIRGSHYPHDPAFTQACDEIGLILFQENAFWAMGGSSGDRGWGGDGPSSSCYPPHYEDQDAFDRNVLSQLKEMIKIHRNGASVAAWSLCNEPFFTDKETDERMKNLLNACTDSARLWDPSRNVAIGGCQRKGIDKLGKGAIAFYNGGGENFYKPGVPNLVSEYGSTVAERPGRFMPGWSNIAEKLFEGGGDPWNPPTWRSGHIIWCGFDHGTVGGRRLATMGIVDYFRLPKRQYYWYKEAYKNGHHEPIEPKWPEEGVPAMLKLEASSFEITSTNGTDDVQLVVTVLDGSGRHISNNVPIEMSIVSGPGEFPTGTSIRFMPPSDSEESDITIRDGMAAIAFRSYYAGKTCIKASSPRLKDAIIEITTIGHPVWKEGKTLPVKDRPYKRYVKDTFGAETYSDALLLAKNRPSSACSEQKGYSKSNVNDDDERTFWQPVQGDKEPWWKLELEAAYCINHIQLEFPKEGFYDYQIELSSNGVDWTVTVKDCFKGKTKEYKKNFGCDIAFLRIRFFSTNVALSELRLGGVPSALGNH